MMRTNRLQIALALCVFLFIGLGFAFIHPGLTDYRPYLSFSPDRDGTKALRTLLEQEGATVREWRLPPDRLPKTGGQLYVAIEPYGVTKAAADELEAWAEDYGNDIVIFEEWPGHLADWEMEAQEDDEYRYAAVPEDEVLLEDEYGVFAARRVAGDGSITSALMPEWTLNGNILEGDRFEKVWFALGGSAAAGKTVYFDEYHHGYAENPGISQVYPPWLLAAFAQAALAAVVWLWVKGKRLGPAYTPREFRVRRSDETLVAVALWHRRGKLARDSLGYRVEHLRKVLQSKGFGVRSDAKAAELISAASGLLKKEMLAALKGVLDRWESQSGTAGQHRHGYSEKQFMADSAVLDEAVRTIEGER